MLKKMMIAGLIVQLFLSATFAHEGHEHEAPKTLKPQKGGVIKSTGAFHFEVVAKGNDLSIFVLDEEMKAANPENFDLSATGELPRTKKVEPIQLAFKENAFVGSYDAKGSHRYTLTLQVKDKLHKKDTKLQYNIEPRKGK